MCLDVDDIVDARAVTEGHVRHCAPRKLRGTLCAGISQEFLKALADDLLNGITHRSRAADGTRRQEVLLLIEELLNGLLNFQVSIGIEYLATHAIALHKSPKSEAPCPGTDSVFWLRWSQSVLRSQKTPSLYPWIVGSWSARSKRFSARQQYKGSISTPKKRRLVF